MSFDTIKELINNFDIENFLPQLDQVLGWVELILRLAVMAGPLLLLGFGLVYLLMPPEEANYSLGYRFWWGMSSLEAWQYTQRVAGFVWTGLGLVLTVIMAIVCNGFRRLAPMDMVWSAIRCLLWELGLTGAACLGVDIAVIVRFDKDGYRRERR